MNTDDGTLTCNGVQITLTKNENKILRILLESKGIVVSREKLMNPMWKTDCFIDENTLTVNVATQCRMSIFTKM